MAYSMVVEVRRPEVGSLENHIVGCIFLFIVLFSLQCNSNRMVKILRLYHRLLKIFFLSVIDTNDSINRHTQKRGRCFVWDAFSFKKSLHAHTIIWFVSRVIVLCNRAEKKTIPYYHSRFMRYSFDVIVFLN